jgi:hypothetical protein
MEGRNAMKRSLLTKSLVIVMMSMLVLGLSSCGKDGKDGEPYVKFDWIGSGILSFSSNIPGLPSTITIETYYKTSAGTYTFEYVHNDRPTILWTGTVTFEKGESGGDAGLFSDGEDGADHYYEITLYAWLGPILSDYGSSALKQADAPGAQYQAVQQIARDGWIVTLTVDAQQIGE